MICSQSLNFVSLDVTTLHKLLVENYKEMSRWEVYKNEVESGCLQWGSVHTEAFFKENARMLEGSDGDFKLLKVCNIFHSVIDTT